VDETGERVTEAQVSHVENEVVVRSANIVRAAEALLKLVSDLKEVLILNDFSFINEITTQRIEELQNLSAEQSRELMELYASVGREQVPTSDDTTTGLPEQRGT
jgi:mediator of RNA polymerase II transcription subunit 22